LNHRKPRPRSRPEQALGRSRGGWSTKIHLAVDGGGRPLALHLTGGQAADSPQFERVLSLVSVPRAGPGRPRSRPQRVLADKGYSARANRAHLRRRGIGAVIPERDDQLANRRRRGRKGGRPYGFDIEAYRDRNLVERGFNRFKQWRGIATRYDKTATNYLGGLQLAGIIMWADDLAHSGDTP
jgi:transposase